MVRLRRFVLLFGEYFNAFCSLQAEDRVLSYIMGENRPFNVQLVADMMAQFGIKKPQVQRAVDSLSEAGKITCKVRRYAALS